MEPEVVVSAEDVAYEEEVLREPCKVSGWVRYLAARRGDPMARRAAIYERALPGSYKLWHSYLTELAAGASASRAHGGGLDAAFERALAAGMSRMPRVWHMYASSLLDWRRLTRTRRVLDRALRALPVAQHRRHVWPLLLRLASLPGCPAPTELRVLRRHLQADPDSAEDFVAFLVSAGRWRDTADRLAAAVSDDGFVSAKGRTKRDLLLDLCGILAEHPEEVAGMPVDAIIRAGIRGFPDEAGVLWTCLAGRVVGADVRAFGREVRGIREKL